MATRHNARIKSLSDGSWQSICSCGDKSEPYPEAEGSVSAIRWCNDHEKANADETPVSRSYAK